MERQIADGTRPQWESPTVTQIRVSAEVTAYAGHLERGGLVDHDGAPGDSARRAVGDAVEGLIGRVGARTGIGSRRRVSAVELHVPPMSRGADRLAASVARSQSSIAVSADRQQWFLFNASPDIQSQIESFPDLHPDDGRVIRLQSVLLTDAELDHTLGLLLMREGRGLEVHATESVHETLTSGSGVLKTLEAYCPVKWQPVLPGAEVRLAGNGLSYCAFDVPTDKQMRFPGGRDARPSRGLSRHRHRHRAKRGLPAVRAAAHP